MEMLARNQLVVVNSFQKRESLNITYRGGNNRTEIDLPIVRSCKRNNVRDCKVLAGEHITSQHEPLVYEMWIGRNKQRRRKQRQVIRWWKCEGEVMESKSKVGSSGYLKNKGRMWKLSGQHLKKALLEQLRRYMAEHQESPHKVERRKNSSSGTRKLNKQYKKRRRH